MTTPAHHEWPGLEAFVRDLRRLEAPAEPDVPLVHAPSQSRWSSPSRSAWPWRMGMLAAGIGALVLARSGLAPAAPEAARREAARSETRPPDSPRSARTDTAARSTRSGFLSPWPSVALAQAAPGAPPLVPYAPLAAIDPTRLRAGHRTYVRLSANDYHSSLPHEVWTSDLDTTQYEGAAAWRLVRRVERYDWRGQPLHFSDTLWMRRTDLRPLARRASQGMLTVRRFAYTDSTLIEIDSIIPPPELLPPATSRRPRPRTFGYRRVQSLRPGTPYIVSMEYLRLLLRAAPLSATWRASVQVEQTPYNQPRNAGFVNLRVSGVDTVQLFSGRFPTWRVVVEGTMRPETWFVSQSTGETLLTDGPLDLNYPESRTMLLYGLEETIKAPPVRRR